MTDSKPVRPIQPYTGSLGVVTLLPGSESIANGLLLLATLAWERFRTSGILRGDNTNSFTEALADLGFRLKFNCDGDKCPFKGTGAAETHPGVP